MKTSNKLLILLGALLIIVPIVAFSFHVKMNYRYFVKEDTFTSYEINNEPFTKKSISRLAIPISKPFNSLNIEDAKNMKLLIHLNSSKVTGVKIPEYAKDYFTFDIDANGVLSISVKGNPNIYNEVPISIYSPSFKVINVSNSDTLVMYSVVDSIQANLKNTRSFSFTYTDTKLYVKNDGAEVMTGIPHKKIKELSVNLTNSNFKSNGLSYLDLNITSKGNTQIYISGNGITEIDGIKNLKINTIDKAKIVISGIKVENLSGKLSDQTTIQLPAKNLKKLFKN